MPFPPSGSIYLIGGLRIDNNYTHSPLFDNQTDQLTYFTDPTRVKHQDTDYSYIRKDQTIKFKKKFEDLWDVNYMLYQNEMGKWIFSFITDKVYINDNVTEILFETDVLQTYMFDYVIEQSYIEREHQDRWWGVANPKLNINDENLAYGDEYVKTFEKTFREGSDKNIAWFLVVATEAIEFFQVDPQPTTLPPSMVQGTPSPLYYYLIPLDRRDTSGSLYNYFDGSGNSILTALDFSNYVAEEPRILSMSYVPYLPFIVNVSEVGVDVTITVSSNEWISLQATTVGPTFHILRLNTDELEAFDDFIIGNFQKYEGKPLPGGFNINQPRDYLKESKLLTFPYTYNLLTDNQATPMMVKNEYVPGDIEFIRCAQSMNINPKTKYYIDSYRGENNGKMYNIINTTVNDLPLKSDAYINYLSQNRASATTGIALSLGGAALSLGIGAASGGVALPLLAGTALSGVSTVGAELAKRKDLQTTPDSLKHSGNNIAFSFVDDSIDLRHMRFEIDTRWKKILGDFWATYGYKCNELKIPDLKSRYYYNYIKMYQANIYGDIDNDELTRIRQIFEAGVTFWHYNDGDINMINDYKFDNVERKFV